MKGLKRRPTIATTAEILKDYKGRSEFRYLNDGKSDANATNVIDILLEEFLNRIFAALGGKNGINIAETDYHVIRTSQILKEIFTFGSTLLGLS